MEGTISALDDLPKEILVEILYRLHIKPLFRCNCVSKQFNSLISDPKFGLNYLQSSSSLCHLSALLYPKFGDGFANYQYIDSIGLPTEDDAPPSLLVDAFYRPGENFSIEVGENYSIKSSSDGLLLSLLQYEKFQICVFNPLTNQSVRLPTLNLPDYQWACGLATRAPQRVGDSQDSVTYKVVCIQFICSDRPDTLNSFKFAKIDIFSSDNGRWTRKERIRCPTAVTIDYSPQLLTYKGILHYFDWRTRTVVTYDPYDSPEGFGCIQLPDRSGKKLMNSGVNLIRLGLQGSLEFGDIEDCGDGDWRLCVWRLVDYEDKREWCLQNRCPISPQWDPSLLGECRLLVAPDPLNAEFFCWLSAYKNKVFAHHLASAEKVSVDLKVKAEWAFTLAVVPISLNPWSSPFHGAAAADRNSSSTAGIRKISAWFPSYAK